MGVVGYNQTINRYAFLKDEARYENDPQYRRGWDDGYKDVVGAHTSPPKASD